MQLYRLTAHRFEELVTLTRLKDKAIETSRSVLVDGLSQSDAARRHDVKRQSVSAALKVINQAAIKANVSEDCLVSLEMVVPCSWYSDFISLRKAVCASAGNLSVDSDLFIRATKELIENLRKIINSAK